MNTNKRNLLPKTMSAHEALNALSSGKFGELIGAVESETLDFKGTPYRLESIKEKVELCKDISALANAGGGVLVMGIGTCVLEGHPHEVAERIRSFPEAMLDVKQYDDIVANWIYPRPNIDIKWVSSSEDAEKGIAYIRVPESQAGRKPFLTVAVLQEDDRMLGNVVGFFQRKGDKVVHWSAEELHHAFKDGLRFDEYLSGIGETLGEILSQRRTQEAYGIDQETIEARIANAIEAVGLADSTSYVLVSYPETTVEITGLFESRTSDVVKLIDNPRELRYAGFDITTGERSRIVNGEFRRSVLKSYKLVDVWRDGTIVSIGDGGEGFLCWGDYAKEEFLRINPIALIESAYLFTLFVKEVFERGQAALHCSVRMELHVRNIPRGIKYGLSMGKPGSLGWRFNLDRQIAWASEQNFSVTHTWAWRNITPENAAYELVSKLYAKFGLEHEFIPYVKEQDSQKVIDVEEIKKIR